jgi:hypothetical protein
MKDCESMVYVQICEMWVYDNILSFPITFSIDLVQTIPFGVCWTKCKEQCWRIIRRKLGMSYLLPLYYLLF